ncbi:MAG: hypothetical protein U0R17_04640 [Acidimicrobiia bacterium]
MKTRTIKAIATAFALSVLPACSHTGSSIDPNRNDDTTLTTDGNPNDTTRSETGGSWEMACTDGVRVTFNGGLKGNITVADLPAEGIHTYEEDVDHFNAVANVIIPVTPDTSDSALNSINNGAEINAYGYQTSRMLLFDPKTRTTDGSGQWAVTIPTLANGNQLSRFSFYGIRNLFTDSAPKGNEQVGEKYEAPGQNFVMVIDSEKKDALALIHIPKDPKSSTGRANKAETVYLDDKTKEHPLTLTFDIPGPNGAPSSVNCDFYSFKKDQAAPPTVSRGPLTI